jgi:hypothetical protein
VQLVTGLYAELGREWETDDRGGGPRRALHMYVFLNEPSRKTIRCICLPSSCQPLPTGDLPLVMMWNIYRNAYCKR